MRIPCCHCGPRGHEEFSYLGDAKVVRPTPSAWGQAPALGASDGTQASGQGSDPVKAFADYVYLRDNPAGLHRELWQHVGGCRAWLVVTRDTRTHAVVGVEPARDVARAGWRAP